MINSEKIKVVYMITKGNFGGAQKYVFDLASNLPENEFDVTVALGEGETLEKKLAEKNIKTIKINLLSRNIKIINDFVAFFEIVKILRKEKPDILHLNSSKVGGLGALAGRLTGVKKIIFTGHGWAFNEERGAISKIIIFALHWFTILLAHKTIALGERIKEQIKFFPRTKSKIILIYNGINDISFLEKNAARDALLPQKTNLTWIGTISELHKNKGLDFAIKAFALVSEEFRNVIFVIIGEGEEREKLEKMIEDYNLNERIFLVGFKDDAKRYLKAFDIGTLTSRTECFPYVPLEMGIASLPVISSWVGGIPEIIINKESGILVQKGNVSEIVKAFMLLLKDTAGREKLGENLRKRVLDNFNLSRMVDSTVALYKNDF